MNFFWNNGIKGFSLQTAGGGADIFKVYQDWGDPLYSVLGGVTNTILSNAYQQAITLQAAQQSGSILLSVQNNGTNIFSNSYTTTDTVSQIRFYAGNLDPAQEGSATNHSIYFNTIAVVPEPSTYALLGLSAMGMAGYVIRRRRR